MVILHITPLNLNKFHSEINKKLEKSTLPVPDIDLTKNINFFNNTTSHTALSGYDQYYSYTKVFPLFDKRRMRENRQYPLDIWENIYEQEKYKAVPSTTSMNYGRRPFYDDIDSDHNRHNVIGQFYRRKGMFFDMGSSKVTESFYPHEPI